MTISWPTDPPAEPSFVLVNPNGQVTYVTADELGYSPSAPRLDVTVTATSSSVLTVAWSSPDGPVTNATYGRDGDPLWTSSAGMRSPQTLTFLKPATKYAVTVTGKVGGQTVTKTVPGTTAATSSKPDMPTPPVVTSPPTPPATGAPSGTITPVWSDTWVDRMSLTTHANYKSLDEVRSIIAPALADSGVRHWRDGGPNNDGWAAKVKLLSADGRTGSVTCDPRDGNNPDTVLEYLNRCGGADAIWLVEGCNELDINKSVAWNGKSLWPVSLRDFQNAMYDKVKSVFGDKILVGTPSIAFPEASSTLGEVRADVANGHFYQGGALPDDQLNTRWIPNVDRLGGGGKRPVFASETGFHLQQSLAGQPGISMTAAAKYVPRLFADYFWWSQKLGRTIRASLYNLSTDQWSVLLDPSGKRTPAYAALVATTTLLADKGSAPSLSPVQMSIFGDVRSTVLAKRDGTLLVLMWRNERSANQGVRTDLSVARVPVTVSLAQAREGTVYRPSTAGTQPDETTSGSTHSVQVGDELTVLALK